MLTSHLLSTKVDLAFQNSQANLEAASSIFAEVWTQADTNTLKVSGCFWVQMLTSVAWTGRFLSSTLKEGPAEFAEVDACPCSVRQEYVSSCPLNHRCSSLLQANAC